MFLVDILRLFLFVELRSTREVNRSEERGDGREVKLRVFLLRQVRITGVASALGWTGRLAVRSPPRDSRARTQRDSAERRRLLSFERIRGRLGSE